ncbi:SIMPL domain-containing protein [Croceibacterium sp. TMG7-5b_MA50]|uniref:SIMPL domain-containing protein n=1 Tax=Croceibacterium sp. TMG7-5b_MA50 TaxID=3121290 RepID=UPI003221A917
MNVFRPAAAFVASAVAAAAILNAPVQAATVQVATTGPVVELTVSESVEVEPDQVNVGAGVTTEAPTAVEALRNNSTQMTQVIARLKQLGVAERDIQTTGINLGARYDYDQAAQRQVFRGYQASNRVQVKLREIDRAGEVLDALVSAGATDLSGPDFSVADDSAARAQARQRAMATAQAQARDYARMAGYSDVRLVQVQEGVAPGMPQPVMRVQAMEAAAPPIQPGMVEAGVTIVTTYELTR